MATFCTKCGASLTSDTGFCTSCGAPVGAAALPPQLASPPPVEIVPPAPAYAQPVAYPPPVKKPGSALKIILIIVAIVITLGIIGVAGVSLVAYRTIHANGNSMSVGSTTDVSEADLGISLYPGAVANPNGAVRVKVGNILTVSAGYTTSDPPTSVIAYYQSQIRSMPGANVTVRESGAATTLTSATTTDTLKETLVVTITPSASGSVFTIAHTKMGGQ